MIKKPRCVNHKDRAELPRLCHVCQRIAVEHDIAAKLVTAAFAAGYELRVDNGDEPSRQLIGVVDALSVMFETDDEYLYFIKDGNEVAWVRLVYGNSGYDVVSDYTTNLEELMTPIMAFAETMR